MSATINFKSSKTGIVILLTGLSQSVYVAKRDQALRLCHLKEGSEARCVQTHHFPVNAGNLLIHLALEKRAVLRLQCQNQDVSLAVPNKLELFPLLRLGGVAEPTKGIISRGFSGVVGGVKFGNEILTPTNFLLRSESRVHPSIFRDGPTDVKVVRS